MQVYESKELVLASIKKQISVLFTNFNSDKKAFHIHRLYGYSKPDLVRQSFAVFALSKTKTFLENEMLSVIKDTIFELEKRIKENFEAGNIIGLFYLARAKNNFDLDCFNDCEFIEKLDLNLIYKHPVSMYVFVSMVHELSLPTESYLYSIRNECMKILEYLLFSNSIDQYPIFSLAEVNYWKNDLVDSSDFLENANNYLLNRLASENLNNISSSGLAKCAEFLSLTKNHNDLFNKVLTELDKRRIKNFPSLLLLDKFKNENMFLENFSNGHICLDTNTHLLLAYQNLYKIINDEI